MATSPEGGADVIDMDQSENALNALQQRCCRPSRQACRREYALKVRRTVGQRDRSWTSLVGGKDLLRVVAAATAIIRGVLPADALAGFRPVEMRKGECFARKRKGAGPCPWAMGLIVTLKSAWRHGRRTFLTVTSQRWRPWACVPACKTTRSCPRACANVQLAAHTVRRGVTKLAYAFGGAPPHTHTHTHNNHFFGNLQRQRHQKQCFLLQLCGTAIREPCSCITFRGPVIRNRRCLQQI